MEDFDFWLSVIIALISAITALIIALSELLARIGQMRDRARQGRAGDDLPLRFVKCG
jgi:uncharacterized integral membrane protein